MRDPGSATGRLPVPHPLPIPCPPSPIPFPMTNEIKVALAVLVAIAAIYGGVRFLSGQPLFGAGYEVVAVFGDAQGLTPGSVVRLNGVRIGNVDAVALGPNARQVFVTMAIDGGVEIPRGSTVQTSGLSALGEVNIEITPPAGAATPSSRARCRTCSTCSPGSRTASPPGRTRRSSGRPTRSRRSTGS